MVSIDARNRIRVEHIKCILEHLYSGDSSTAVYKKFARLQLISKRIESLPRRVIAHSVLLQYVVQELLFELIEANLQKQRFILGLKHRQLRKRETRKQAMADIRQDASVAASDLVGWSFLYHVFLRPDFNISQEDFAKVAHIHPRTARRYKQRMTNLLLQEIIRLELSII